MIPRKFQVPQDNAQNKFIRELNLIDWATFNEEIGFERDPDVAYERFLNLFTDTYNKNFKFSKKIPRRKIPKQEWMTPGLINCCRVKSNLYYKRYKLCPSLQNEDIYKKYRNKLKLVLKKAEKDFYCSKLQVHSGDLKQFWKILNKLIKSNSFSDILMEFEYNGQNLSDPVIIVDKFNDFFTNIGSNLASNVPDTSTYFRLFLRDLSVILFHSSPLRPLKLSMLSVNFSINLAWA